MVSFPPVSPPKPCAQLSPPTLWMLIMIPFADVLGLYTLQDKTVLCYIHTLQSQVPFTHVLGLGNLQYKIVLCHTLYIMQFPYCDIFLIMIANLLEVQYDCA
jgi:hypothetical protein